MKTSVEQRASKLINILKVEFIMHKIMVVLYRGLPSLWLTEGEGEGEGEAEMSLAP